MSNLKQRLYPLYWQLLTRYLNKRQPAASQVRLTQKLIFILPTRYGWWFLLLMVLLYLLGTNYQNNLILLLSYLLLSLFLFSIALSYQNISGLTIQSQKPAESFAGEYVKAQLSLSSQKQPKMLQFNLVQHNELIEQPELKHNVSFNLAVTKRGKYQLPRVKISSQYPFGLWRVWSYIAIEQIYWVYPAPATHLVANTSVADHDARQFIQPSGDNLAAYQAGDSIRHLVWKRLARDPANPVVRQQLIAPQAEPSWVVVPKLTGDALERALRQACQQLLVLEKSGTRYGLKLPNLTLAQAVGPLHLQRCLQALALC